MAEAQVWKVTYNILNVNGAKYYKAPDRIKAYEEQMPTLLKESAEKLADRADFPVVEMTAVSETTGQKYSYKHVADTGFASEWVTGRQ